MVFGEGILLTFLASLLLICSAGIFVVLRSRRYVGIFKILALICLALSVLGIAVEKNAIPRAGLVLVDISDSMDPDVSDTLLQNLRMKRRDVELGVGVFGAQATFTGDMLSSVQSFRALQSSWGNADIGYSNLEGALRSIQGTDTVYLISDGFENGGDVAKVFDDLRSKKIKVSPIVPDTMSNEKDYFRITQLHAPLIAPASSSVDIRVTVSNTTSSIQKGTLLVSHDGKEIYTDTVIVEPGKEKVVVVPSDPSQEGIKEIKAQLTPHESSQKISSEVRYLSGELREKILLISGSIDDARLIAPALTDQSYQLTSKIVEDSRMPLSDLSQYKTVIFNNVSTKQLDPLAPEAVKKYVEHGGGFLMIGGNKSFGLGGYKDTAIEQTLPVSLVPPQTEQKRLNVAVQLVLDKSQSMAADSKIEFVKEAARETIRSLKNDDYIGVIPFDSVPFLLIRMSLVGQIRNEAIDKISRIFPTGSTNLMPALQAAKQELERAPAGRKHIIILTDGKLPDGARGHFWYVEQIKQLRITGVTVSTVMLGPESDTQLLREMAQTGGGAFYQTTDPNRLPQIFVSDVKVSTGEKTLKESTEYDVRRGPQGVRSTAIENFPPVQGYVQTKIKEKADLELIAYSAQTAEPLLATWNFGKGRAVAFTSDANGRWSRQWAEWPRFREFWRDILNATRAEEGESNDVRFELRPYIERGILTLDLAVFSPRVDQAITGELMLPSGQPHAVQFEKISEGHYKAYIDRPIAGKYTLKTNVQGKPVTPVAFAVSGESFGEQKHRGFNRPLLERIASETGGIVNPKDEKTHETVELPKETTDVTYIFLLCALALLCLEIYLREVHQIKSL